MGRLRGAAFPRDERGNDEQQREFSPYEVGLCLPHRVDIEVQEEGDRQGQDALDQGVLRQHGRDKRERDKEVRA